MATSSLIRLSIISASHFHLLINILSVFVQLSLPLFRQTRLPPPITLLALKSPASFSPSQNKSYCREERWRIVIGPSHLPPPHDDIFPFSRGHGDLIPLGVLLFGGLAV